MPDSHHAKASSSSSSSSPTEPTMPSGRVPTILTAAGVVAAADQAMQGIRDQREEHRSHANEHYIKAAIAAAIAVGAYTMLKDDENEERDDHHRPHIGADHRPDKPDDNKGRGMDLLAEAAGAYSLGRQMLGHNDNRIMKLIAEALGAAALAKEADRDLVD